MLDAAFQELGDGGYAALTVERIAQRSGVHAATIYRRWRTIERIVCELMVDISAEVPLPDTGALADDLRALARSIAAFYAEPRFRGLLEAVVSAAAREPAAADVLREFFEERLRLAGRMVHRAVERGELAGGADADEIMAALGAPFYYRLLIARRPIDLRLADRAAEAAWTAARAGIFTRGPQDAEPGTADLQSAEPQNAEPGNAELQSPEPRNAEPGNAEGGR
ncbi:TetR family transcriptional regulator [Streptomyces sp. WAC 06783]|uniref:TetR/AcrR family transcriptional regulator n=1 Tax=Streptomyces sp. WAC 06783 TaxID=2203211 RepID=UPI000F74872D|nr:TetR/AcrR family transcriptional regulator [Streptomyces sp. WAC 06783]RSO10379.1 TetR family transcriptional regulator [Streptomyces sp. WAC 06783]